jgi:hypothetical protein
MLGTSPQKVNVHLYTYTRTHDGITHTNVEKIHINGGKEYRNYNSLHLKLKINMENKTEVNSMYDNHT